MRIQSLLCSQAQGTEMDSEKISVADCDDVLMEILQRLPMKSLFRFNLVSRRWNQIISDDPSFRFSYVSRIKKHSSYHHLPLLCFFRVPLSLSQSSWNPKIMFKSTSDDDESQVMVKKNNEFLQQEQIGYLIASSNGLLLCGHNRTASYCICNPITLQYYPLPKPHRTYYNLGVGGFHYDEEDESYRVLLVSQPPCFDSRIHLETFSSKTCKWTESIVNCHRKLGLPRYHFPSVIGGVFYWFWWDYMVLAYDPSQIHHRLHPFSILLPGRIGSVRPPGMSPRVLGESSDGRLQYAVFRCLEDEHESATMRFQVWVLKEKLSYYYDLNGNSVIAESEWVMRYSVNYKKLISNAFPEMMDSEIDELIDVYLEENVPRVVAFHPQNSQLVFLQLMSRLMIYDLGTESLELVQLCDPDYKACNSFPYFQPPWPPSPHPRKNRKNKQGP